MTRLELSDERLAMLTECHAESRIALDRLPYSREFDELCERFRERSDLDIDCHHLWRALRNLRKAKKLVRKNR